MDVLFHGSSGHTPLDGMSTRCKLPRTEPRRYGKCGPVNSCHVVRKTSCGSRQRGRRSVDYDSSGFCRPLVARPIYYRMPRQLPCPSITEPRPRQVPGCLTLTSSLDVVVSIPQSGWSRLGSIILNLLTCSI